MLAVVEEDEELDEDESEDEESLDFDGGVLERTPLVPSPPELLESLRPEVL